MCEVPDTESLRGGAELDGELKVSNICESERRLTVERRSVEVRSPPDTLLRVVRGEVGPCTGESGGACWRSAFEAFVDKTSSEGCGLREFSVVPCDAVFSGGAIEPCGGDVRKPANDFELVRVCFFDFRREPRFFAEGVELDGSADAFRECAWDVERERLERSRVGGDLASRPLSDVGDVVGVPDTGICFSSGGDSTRCKAGGLSWSRRRVSDCFWSTFALSPSILVDITGTPYPGEVFNSGLL